MAYDSGWRAKVVERSEVVTIRYRSERMNKLVGFYVLRTTLRLGRKLKVALLNVNVKVIQY